MSRTDLMRSLGNPDRPMHFLYNGDEPRAKGWVDAGVHASKAFDRMVNGASRVLTPGVGAVVMANKALRLPGWKKAAVVPAPVIGLLGGTLLGAGGFLWDTAHVLGHSGSALGHAVYAIGHNGFEAMYDDITGVWRAAEAYATEDTQTARDLHRERAAQEQS